MASFTDLIAERIHFRREEFLAGLSSKPDDEVEYLLAKRIQAHWHPFEPENTRNMDQSISQVAAVDGSRAIRALSSGADWVIAQALLIGPNGLRKSAVDTILLRGEIERPAVDRCAALLMRSLELDLALKFVESGDGHTLILDGSLYAELPYLLYRLAIGGYEDLPLKVLELYLELFDLCQKRGVLLLGISNTNLRSKSYF
jgi:NurA domain